MEDEKEEVIKQLAHLKTEKRAQHIRQIFTELTRQCNKETFVSKELYLKQIILFYRNIVVNYFPRLLKDHAMCLAVEEVMEHRS